jgi:hypothetical protein
VHDRTATRPAARAIAAGLLAAGMLGPSTQGLTAAPAAAEALDAASPTHTAEGTVEREPCADRAPLRRPFFGDLHVHTAFSLDASTMGTVNRPADAYRFARGERIGLQPYGPDGAPLRTARLARPLDFAAVTDHSELLGEAYTCNTPGLSGHDSIVCRIYRGWPRAAFFWMNFQASRGVRHDFCGEDGRICREAARTPWREIVEAAEAAYDRSGRCRFTSFIGYEWTGSMGTGNNYHRNVIFANDAVPELPISFIDEPDLQRFWSRLGEDCRDAGTGCDVVVIPHNSNLSGGEMFRTVTGDGTPISRAEAEGRHRFEVLVEVMQHKGDSECLPGAGTTDELCAFEKLAENSFSGRFYAWRADPPLPRQFVRHALREGLREERRLGVNPFRFGIIASTDTHLGTPGLAAESPDFPGHGGAGKPPGDALPTGLPDHVDFNPGGLAVLWAEENTRTALFAAMKRREAYGTSGPRMVVRFFGGWGLPDDLCSQADWPRIGYARGVPMGGRLGEPPTRDAAPTFVVSALADPGTAEAPGTPLQRVQIVKGWATDDATYERVYEVAGDADNGAGVDLLTCEPHGEGSTALCSVWRDPDFDPGQSAFYYARAVENPTCRWSQKLCRAAGVRCDDAETIAPGFEDCCAESHRPVIQERAWTSPIWYRPPAS